MELVIICSTYRRSTNLSHFTLPTISPQVARKRPITFPCTRKHALTRTSPSDRGPHFRYTCTFPLCSICIAQRPPQVPHPPSSTAHPPNALTVWGWKPIRLLGSTHERIPVKAPTEENGPCPLIYRLSHENLLMHLELTSCVQKPISLLFPFYTILLHLINHHPLCPFNNISAVRILRSRSVLYHTRPRRVNSVFNLSPV